MRRLFLKEKKNEAMDGLSVSCFLMVLIMLSGCVQKANTDISGEETGRTSISLETQSSTEEKVTRYLPDDQKGHVLSVILGQCGLGDFAYRKEYLPHTPIFCLAMELMTAKENKMPAAGS